ncbi:MAG: hypothetical protein ACE5KI_03980 [Dehalococcoidia bacterium]
MSKAWLMVLALAAVLVTTFLVSMNSSLTWAAPFTDDGGSTIPVPPPEPPSPGSGSNDSFFLEELRFDPDSTMLTVDGRPVEASDSPPILLLDPSGKQTIQLPLALPLEAELDEFQDTSSGIQWQPGPTGSYCGTLIISLIDERASLILFLEEVLGDGYRMVGVISGVDLILDPIPVSFQQAVEGEVRFAAELRRLPREVALGLEEVDPKDPDLLSALEKGAGSFQLQIADVAYAFKLEVVLTGDQVPSMIKTVSINMQVAESWAERWPEEATRIVRVDSLGRTGFLDTISVPSDSPGQASFVATSPEGFSTFALAALEGAAFESSAEDSFLALWLGVALGSVAALTLTGVLIILRLRRRGA